MINRFSRIHPQKPAQALVEFALALPLLMLLVIGVLEAGRLMFIYGSVTTAAREAVRYASAVGVNESGVQHFQDCSGIRAAAKKVGFLQGFNDNDINITYDRGVNVANGTPVAITLPGGGQIDPAPSTDNCPLANPSTLRNGDRVVVQVSLLYAPIIPFVPLDSFEIKSTSARTVIVNVAIEVTAPPQGWSPNATDTPTSTNSPTPEITDTPTNTSTATQTPLVALTLTTASTATQIPTVTDTPTITSIPTQKIPPGHLDSVIVESTPTSTPIPSCASLTVTDARFNDDDFEIQVRNDNIAPAYLINSRLDWDTTYAPTMYFNEASFGSRYFTENYTTSPINMPAPSLRIDGRGATQWWKADFNNTDTNWKDGYYGASLTFSFPYWGDCNITGVKTLYTPTPSHTPTVPPTRTPTPTPTTTGTAVNCMLVTHDVLTRSGDTLYMDITNNTGAILNASQVTVTWNHDKGHDAPDKSLRLRQVTLNSTGWSGDISAPSYTVPSYFPEIPTGPSRMTFTFHQNYQNLDGTERVVILLSNNGCTNYTIDSAQ